MHPKSRPFNIGTSSKFYQIFSFWEPAIILGAHTLNNTLMAHLHRFGHQTANKIHESKVFVAMGDQSSSS